MVAGRVALFCALGRLLDVAPVRRGGVVVVPNYLPADLVAALRADACRLRDAGLFRASGLRDNTISRSAPQAYGAEDRLVLAVSPRLGGDRAARARFDAYLDALRAHIEVALDRPGRVPAMPTPPTRSATSAPRTRTAAAARRAR